MYESLLSSSALADAMCVTFDWNADQTKAHVIVWSTSEAILNQGELDVVYADMLDDRTACAIKLHNTDQQTNYWTGDRVYNA